MCCQLRPESHAAHIPLVALVGLLDVLRFLQQTHDVPDPQADVVEHGAGCNDLGSESDLDRQALEEKGSPACLHHAEGSLKHSWPWGGGGRSGPPQHPSQG